MHTQSKILASTSPLSLVKAAVIANAQEANVSSSSSLKLTPGVIDKVANAIKCGAGTAVTGIERGASATGKPTQKVADKIGGWGSSSKLPATVPGAVK